MKTKNITIQEYLKRFDQEKIEALLISAQKGSEKAEGIHLPSYVYAPPKKVAPKPSKK